MYIFAFNFPSIVSFGGFFCFIFFFKGGGGFFFLFKKKRFHYEYFFSPHRYIYLNTYSIGIQVLCDDVYVFIHRVYIFSLFVNR